MIITRLAGGLGNQMFQYAVARNFLKDDGKKVFLDTYLLQEEEEDIEKIIHRPFALGIYNNLRAKVDEKKLSNLLRDGGLINRINRKLFLRNCVVVQQQNMERIELPAELKTAKNIWFIGNFQSERFFKKIKKELQMDFYFPKMDFENGELKKKILATDNAVSVHIRRGDYLSAHHKNVHTSVAIDYYYKAIEVMLSKLNITRVNAFVFTDDIEWAREKFPSSNKMEVYYVTGNANKNSWKDMALMTVCSHHIVANSSFSWWGAWLSEKTGITIAPKYWYLPNTYVYDINDIVPQNWIIVDYCI